MTIITIILLAVGCIVTALVCHKEYESEWQEITYAGGSIEPKDIYICKKCNYKADVKYHYCSNCGALMKNGKTRIYYSDKIKISE